MKDAFDRTVDYLRISVTDRCNERCLYCMPEGYKGWAQKPDHMTSDEIVRTVEAATELGFRKFRITGGEPLIRSDIVEICRRVWELPGVQSLGISTNATRLERHATELRQAGVRAVNISLDALNPSIYRSITGFDLAPVLRGILAALAEGFEAIKLNTVLLRDTNESEFLPLIEFGAAHGMPVRFIELMPLSTGPLGNAFLSVHDAMQCLGGEQAFLPLPDFRPGHGPARYFVHRATGAKVGFIGAMTTPHFCESCNKLRLTADGKLRPCLGRHGEIDLLSQMRAGATPTQAIEQAIANKPENHEFLDNYEPGRPMTAIGG